MRRLYEPEAIIPIAERSGAKFTLFYTMKIGKRRVKVKNFEYHRVPLPLDFVA
jgi:hypothetical protein